MFSRRISSFVGLWLMMTGNQVLSFPALMGGANQPFGHPSQAIYSPSGGNILYRSAAQIPQGQLIPANSELAAKATGGKGRCNVYYYCCIFYCWAKWTPCGCYLVCADSQQGGGELIPVDQGATTNEVFDPPSADLYQPTTPSNIFGGRADVVPAEHHEDDDEQEEPEIVYIEPPPMMMGGGGADKKVSSDDEREQVLTSDDIDQRHDVQYVTQPPSKQQEEEEEADPNEIVAPEWEEHHTTRAPYYEPNVPVDEGEEDPYDRQPEEPSEPEPELPNEEQPYIEEEEFEVDTTGQFDDNEVVDDGDDTLIAFGQVQGRRPLLVRFPQTGVAFEARSSDKARTLERRAINLARKNKEHGAGEQSGRDNKKDKKEKKKQDKANKKEEREERRRQRKQQRKERKNQQQQQQLNNIDNKFIW